VDLGCLSSILNKGIHLIGEQESSVVFDRWIKVSGSSSQWWQLSREQIITLLSARIGMIIMATLGWTIHLGKQWLSVLSS